MGSGQGGYLQGFGFGDGWTTVNESLSFLSPACSWWLTRAAGVACLVWGPWVAHAPGLDCCWAPPRALDSCVPFTASGGNGPSAAAGARVGPTLWTTHRLQSLDAKVGAGLLRPQGLLRGGLGVGAACSRTCGARQQRKN